MRFSGNCLSKRQVLGKSLATIIFLMRELNIEGQGLSQDFKNACPKQQFQKIMPIQIWLLGHFKSLYTNYILQPFVSKRAVYTLSHVLVDKFIGKSICINHNFFREFFACPKRCISGNCLSTRQVGRVLSKYLLKINNNQGCPNILVPEQSQNVLEHSNLFGDSGLILAMNTATWWHYLMYVSPNSVCNS